MIINFQNSIKIMKKDWKTYKRNKEIIISMIVMPFIFTVILPLLIIFGVLTDPYEFIKAIGNKEELVQLLNIPHNYNIYLVAASIAIKLFILPYFLFTPSLLSIILSADSFAGEKERKTFEPLALLPISKKELITGKVLTAYIPTILLNSILFVLLGIEVNLILINHLDGNILLFGDVAWLLTVFLLTPVLTFFNILIIVIITSHTKTLKGAQSISGFLIMPILIFMFLPIFNPAFLSPILIVLLSLILIGLISIILRFGDKLLNIEKLIIMK